MTNAETDSSSLSYACRSGCGACCIAPSISSPIPDMPQGKPAVRCKQLDEQNRCRLYGLPQRLQVCVSLQAEPKMCGTGQEQALAFLAWLEQMTA